MAKTRKQIIEDAKAILKELDTDEEKESVEEEDDGGLVIEKADSGSGFQIYRDYNRDYRGKLRRLSRE